VDAVTADPLTFLRAAHAEAEKAAEAATPGPWSARTYGPGGRHRVLGGPSVQPGLGSDTRTVCRTDAYPADWPTEVVNPTADVRHMALHDPAAVLRRITAERALMADLLAERHFVNDGDCWYTCRAATEERDGGENCNDAERGKPCDCGRDTRVNRRLRLLAEGWGWTESTGE
jgi:hypothetical protein